MIVRRSVGTLSALLLLVACADDGNDRTGGATTAPAATSPPTDPPRWPGDDTNQQQVPVDPETANLTEIKQELEAYHDDGRYEQDLADMAALAEACMLAALPDATRPALVLDIDETALTNYDWMKSVDFLRASPLLTDLFTEHADTSSIPPIEPVLELYRTAMEHDVEVFFVTGRPERLRAVTEKNLVAAGYTDYADSYFSPDDYKEPSIVPFKSGARAAIEQEGYTIIANVGDQDSDLEGGHGGCPHKLVDPFYFIP